MKKYYIIGVFLFIYFQGFGQQSFSIEDAWQYALENNVNVQKAKIDQLKASQRVKETTGIGLPQLNAQGQYNYFLQIPVSLLPAEIAGGPAGTFIPVQFGQKNNMSGGLTLSQLLFNGSYLVGLQSAKAYKETANLVEEKTEISVKEGVLLAYTAVLVTDENLKTIEDNRKVTAKSLYETEQTYKVGLVEFQNVEQLQYSYKSLVANQENLQRTRNKLLMTLKYLIGYPLDQELQLNTTLDELVTKNDKLVNIHGNEDISNHIDMRLAENNIKLNQLLLKLQKSKYLPTLSAALSSNYNGFGNNFQFSSSKQDWFNTSVFAVQLDIPIFNGFQRKWQNEQAKLDLKKAEMDYQDTKRNISSAIYSANVDYENAYNSFINAKDLVELSSSIYKKQQIKFKEGLGTSFELQQAETQLYNSQNQYYQASLNYIQSKTKLDKALGTL